MTSYTVTESTVHPSPKHVAQAVVVGRDDRGGIHVAMTPEAAAALVGILARYDIAHHAFLPHSAASTATDYDHELWNHVSVDLMAARVMALHAHEDDQVAYVPAGIPVPVPELEDLAEGAAR